MIMYYIINVFIIIVDWNITVINMIYGRYSFYSNVFRVMNNPHITTHCKLFTVKETGIIVKITNEQLLTKSSKKYYIV